MLVQDIHQRLTAALPAGVPVLKPDQLLIPGEWEEETPDGDIKEGGERGLHVYLRQRAPAGYVQIEPLTPLPSGVDGIQQRIWATISINAASSDDCQALYDAVHLILCGIPGREPGYYTEKQAGVTAFLTLGYWQARLTLTRPAIGGRI